MVIRGEIQSVTANSYTSAKGVTYNTLQVVVMDRSKCYRCMTPFVVSVPIADREKVFGKKKLSDLTDEKVTVTAPEMSAANGNIRVRGSIYMGHIDDAAILKLTEGAD